MGLCCAAAGISYKTDQPVSISGERVKPRRPQDNLMLEGDFQGPDRDPPPGLGSRAEIRRYKDHLETSGEFEGEYF